VNMDVYHYAGNNPIKIKDPEGNWIETAWDIMSLGASIYSLNEARTRGDKIDVALASTAVVLDVIATALPIVPGGAGIALKSASKLAQQVKTADKILDISKKSSEIVKTMQTLKKEGAKAASTDAAIKTTLKAKMNKYFKPLSNLRKDDEIREVLSKAPVEIYQLGRNIINKVIGDDKKGK